MQRVALTVGRETFDLDLANAIEPDIRSFRLLSGRLRLVAEIYVLHDAICPARLPPYNDASGPCTCGGQAVFDALLDVKRKRTREEV